MSIQGFRVPCSGNSMCTRMIVGGPEAFLAIDADPLKSPLSRP